MVPKVPVARESIAGNGPITSLVGAEVGLVPMSMHGVSFPLMPEQAGSGREPGVLARVNLAAVWLEVGVHKLAVCHLSSVSSSFHDSPHVNLLIVALELLWLVVAVCLSLPRAVEEPVGLGERILVQWVIPGSLAIDHRLTAIPAD